jgi:hypothetical protein
MKLVGAGNCEQTHVQNPGLLDLAGGSVTLEGWIHAATASSGRLQIYTKDKDAVETTTSSSYQTAGAETELISVTANIPANLTDISIRCTVTGANTVYFDNVRLIGGNFPYKVHLPSTITKPILQVQYQLRGDADTIDTGSVWQRCFDWEQINDGTNRFLVFKYVRPTGRKYQILSIEPLSTVSAETDTMEISGDEVKAFSAMAVAEMFSRLASTPTTDDVTRYEKLAGVYKTKAEEYLRKHGMARPSGTLKGLVV